MMTVDKFLKTCSNNNTKSIKKSEHFFDILGKIRNLLAL